MDKFLHHTESYKVFELILQHWSRVCKVFDDTLVHLQHIQQLPNDVIDCIVQCFYSSVPAVNRLIAESEFAANLDPSREYQKTESYFCDSLTVSDISLVDIRMLEEYRYQIYSQKVSDMTEALFVLVVEFTHPASNNFRTYENIICAHKTKVRNLKNASKKTVVEDAVIVRDEFKNLVFEDMLYYDDYVISDMIEYSYDVPQGALNKDASVDSYQLSFLCYDAFLKYKKHGFNDWLQGIDTNPDVIGRYTDRLVKRMVKMGLRTHITDPTAFPVPIRIQTEYANAIERKDANYNPFVLSMTKKLYIPIKSARKWNVEKRCYDELDTRLDGAPVGEQEEKVYWDNLLKRIGKYDYYYDK